MTAVPAHEARRRARGRAPMTPARAVRATLVGLALGVLLTQFGFTLMRVTGSSMDPNLREGEVLLVLRPPLLALSDLLAGRAPGARLAERGAVVVLPDPRAEGGPLGVGRPLIVKRVVGLPGDTVALARGRVAARARCTTPATRINQRRPTGRLDLFMAPDPPPHN